MFYSARCEVWAPVPRVPGMERGKSVSHRKLGGGEGEKRVCGLNTHLWILDISFSVCVSCSIPFRYSVPLDVSLYLLGLSFYIYKMGSLMTAL